MKTKSISTLFCTVLSLATVPPMAWMKTTTCFRTIYKGLFTGLLMVIFFIPSSAQTITNYTFAASSGTFTALTSPTNPALTGGTVDDGLFDNIPIGCDFFYMGTRYTAHRQYQRMGFFKFRYYGGAGWTNDLTGAGEPRPYHLAG
ncbi:MAG: hypothetical protein WKI04_15440 [Ferruginibacter sp.]